MAQKWRRIVIRAFSEALWGWEMDRQQPLLRGQITLLTIAIALILLLIGKFLSGLTNKWRRHLYKQLQEIKNSLLVEPEATTRHMIKEQSEGNTPLQNIFDNGRKIIAEVFLFLLN